MPAKSKVNVSQSLKKNLALNMDDQKRSLRKQSHLPICNSYACDLVFLTEPGALLEQWKPVAVLSLSAAFRTGSRRYSYTIWSQSPKQSSYPTSHRDSPCPAILVTRGCLHEGDRKWNAESVCRTVITTCLLKSRLHEVDSEKNR